VDWIEIACGRAYDGKYFLFPKKAANFFIERVFFFEVSFLLHKISSNNVLFKTTSPGTF